MAEVHELEKLIVRLMFDAKQYRAQFKKTIGEAQKQAQTLQGQINMALAGKQGMARRASQLWKQHATSAELYKRELKEINTLLRGQAITQKQAVRYVQGAKARMEARDNKALAKSMEAVNKQRKETAKLIEKELKAAKVIKSTDPYYAFQQKMDKANDLMMKGMLRQKEVADYRRKLEYKLPHQVAARKAAKDAQKLQDDIRAASLAKQKADDKALVRRGNAMLRDYEDEQARRERVQKKWNTRRRRNASAAKALADRDALADADFVMKGKVNAQKIQQEAEKENQARSEKAQTLRTKRRRAAAKRAKTQAARDAAFDADFVMEGKLNAQRIEQERAEAAANRRQSIQDRLRQRRRSRMQAGESLRQEMMTPDERRAHTRGGFDRMLASGAISAETHARAVRSLGVEYGAFGRGLQRVQGFAEGLAQRTHTLQNRLRALGGTFGSLGTTFSIFVTTPIVGGLTAMVNKFMVFEDNLTKALSIVPEKTTRMREDLRKVSNEMGLRRDNVFNREQVAGGFEELIKGGLDFDQALKALNVTTSFATAGDMDLAKATEILLDAQSALGLKSKDATVNMENMAAVSDMITNAAVATTASIEQMGKALTSKAASAIRVMNMDVAEGVALLGLYTQAGIKGSAAGNKFSIMQRELIKAAIKKPEAVKAAGLSPFDDKGNLVEGVVLLKRLSDAFKGLNAEQKFNLIVSMGFRAEARDSILTLIDLEEEFVALTEKVKQSGSTMEIAKQRSDTYANRINKLWNEVTTLSDGVARFGHVFDMVEAKIREGIKWWDELSRVQQNAYLEYALWIAALGPSLMVIGAATNAISGLLGIVSMVAGTFGEAISLSFRFAEAITGIRASTLALNLSMTALSFTLRAGLVGAVAAAAFAFGKHLSPELAALNQALEKAAKLNAQLKPLEEGIFQSDFMEAYSSPDPTTRANALRNFREYTATNKQGAEEQLALSKQTLRVEQEKDFLRNQGVGLISGTDLNDPKQRAKAMSRFDKKQVDEIFSKDPTEKNWFGFGTHSNEVLADLAQQVKDAEDNVAKWAARMQQINAVLPYAESMDRETSGKRGMARATGMDDKTREALAAGGMGDDTIAAVASAMSAGGGSSSKKTPFEKAAEALKKFTKAMEIATDTITEGKEMARLHAIDLSELSPEEQKDIKPLYDKAEAAAKAKDAEESWMDEQERQFKDHQAYTKEQEREKEHYKTSATNHIEGIIESGRSKQERTENEIEKINKAIQEMPELAAKGTEAIDILRENLRKDLDINFKVHGMDDITAASYQFAKLMMERNLAKRQEFTETKQAAILSGPFGSAVRANMGVGGGSFGGGGMKKSGAEPWEVEAAKSRNAALKPANTNLTMAGVKANWIATAAERGETPEQAAASWDAMTPEQRVEAQRSAVWRVGEETTRKKSKLSPEDLKKWEAGDPEMIKRMGDTFSSKSYDAGKDQDPYSFDRMNIRYNNERKVSLRKKLESDPFLSAADIDAAVKKEGKEADYDFATEDIDQLRMRYMAEDAGKTLPMGLSEEQRKEAEAFMMEAPAPPAAPKLGDRIEDWMGTEGPSPMDSAANLNRHMNTENDPVNILKEIRDGILNKPSQTIVLEQVSIGGIG